MTIEGPMLIDQCEILTERQLLSARLLVAANAENADDAAELMKMLGIHPSQEDIAYTTHVLPTLPGRQMSMGLRSGGQF